MYDKLVDTESDTSVPRMDQRVEAMRDFVDVEIRIENLNEKAAELHEELSKCKARREEIRRFIADSISAEPIETKRPMPGIIN